MPDTNRYVVKVLILQIGWVVTAEKGTLKKQYTAFDWIVQFFFVLVSMLNRHVKAKGGAPGIPDLGWQDWEMGVASLAGEFQYWRNKLFTMTITFLSRLRRRSHPK